MKKRRPSINDALRYWTRGVSFTLAMGRRQVYTLVSLDLSRERVWMRESMVGHRNRHARHFVTSANCLLDRGLIVAPVWQGREPLKGDKIGHLWTVTEAGEHVLALLKCAGIYQEVADDLQHADSRIARSA